MLRTLLSRPGRAGLTLAVLWALAGPAAAAPLPPDPVEDFRQALRQERDPITDRAVLDFRRDTLARKVDALRSLGDMGRILLLQEWRVDSKDEGVAAVDTEMRERLARRFQESARQTLRSPDPLVRAAAANLIGETAAAARTLGPKTAFVRYKGAALSPDLVRLADDPVPAVRAAAARALGRIEPDASTAELAGLIGGAPAERALSARRADLRSVVRVLERLLDDDSPRVRRAAAEGLQSLVEVAAQQEKRSRGALQANLLVRYDLIATGARVVPAAVVGLSPDEPRDVRLACIKACQLVTAALIELVPDPTDPQAVPPPGRPLTARERERYAQERAFLLSEIAELQPVGAAFRDNLPAIARATRDPDPEIRLAARRVLEELAVVRSRLVRRAESIPRLDGPADRPAPPAVTPAADAGPALDDRPALALPVAQDVEPPPAPPAAVPRDDALREALRASVPVLIAGMSDPVARNRLASVEALEALQDEAEPAIPALVQALCDPSLFVRWAAVRTLGELAPRRAALVVPAIVPLFRDPDLDLRIAAANALARYGPEAAPAVEVLARSAARGDPDIRFAVLRALEHIGTAAAPALPEVAQNLGHANPQVRAAACRTLGRFGPLAAFAVPDLRRALTDTDPDVRRAASEALLKVTRQ